MEKKPKNYNELIRLKKCYTLTKYFSNITEEIFDELYDFLGQSPNNTLSANQEVIMLVNYDGDIVKTIPLTPADNSFDSIRINNSGVLIVPHYDPSTYASSSTWSNTNNNNNNNNNNNS